MVSIPKDYIVSIQKSPKTFMAIKAKINPNEKLHKIINVVY